MAIYGFLGSHPGDPGPTHSQLGVPCLLTLHITHPLQVQPLVLLRHHQHFEEWHGRWLEDNVTVEAASLVQDWLMGEEDEDMVPCKTLCETAHVHGLPVTRYRVQYSRRPASP